MTEKPPSTPPYWTEAMSNASGLKALKEGKVAVLLLAGGAASRLGWPHPKGTFPITPFRERTLFQFFSDRIDAASKLYQQAIPVAILTSPDNHEETVKALKRDDWDFCQQSVLPYLDEDKKTELSEKGPDGNGGAFEVLARHGVLDKWEEQGVQLISVVVVENPLADPVDIQWISFHLDGGYDLSFKVVERRSPQEKVGILVETDEGQRILEYNEAERGLEYLYGNTALSIVTLDFAKIAAANTKFLPYHLQWKRIKDDQWGWKRERLLFDHFKWAQNLSAIVYPREETFVPLKTIEDVPYVKKALTSRERKILEKVTETPAPLTVIEIDPAFYYPTPQLLQKWKGKAIDPVAYIKA